MEKECDKNTPQSDYRSKQQTEITLQSRTPDSIQITVGLAKML